MSTDRELIRRALEHEADYLRAIAKSPAMDDARRQQATRDHQRISELLKRA